MNTPKAGFTVDFRVAVWGTFVVCSFWLKGLCLGLDCHHCSSNWSPPGGSNGSCMARYCLLIHAGATAGDLMTWWKSRKNVYSSPWEVPSSLGSFAFPGWKHSLCTYVLARCSRVMFNSSNDHVQWLNKHRVLLQRTSDLNSTIYIALHTVPVKAQESVWVLQVSLEYTTNTCY